MYLSYSSDFRNVEFYYKNIQFYKQFLKLSSFCNKFTCGCFHSCFIYFRPIIGGDKLTTKAADKKSSKKLSFGNIAMAAKKSSLAEAAKANDKTNSAAVNTLSTFTAAAAAADVEKKKTGLDLGSIVKAKMVVTPKLAGKKDEPGNSLKVRKHASKYFDSELTTSRCTLGKRSRINRTSTFNFSFKKEKQL